MAFHKDPFVMTTHPACRYPVSVRAGRPYPLSIRPRVGVTVPAVITRSPNVVTSRSNTAPLHPGTGRGDADHYLRRKRAHCEKPYKK
jgi:hypothetical protein